MIPQGHQVGEATHERKDADVIGVFLLVTLLLLLLAVCLMVVWGLMHFLSAQRPQRPLPLASRGAGAFPEPRLQATPRVDWLRDQSAQQKQLNSYGWVDRQKGIAHIPIDRAVQLLLERGLPEVGLGQTRLQLIQARPQTNLQPSRPIAAPTPGPSP